MNIDGLQISLPISNLFTTSPPLQHRLDLVEAASESFEALVIYL